MWDFCHAAGRGQMHQKCVRIGISETSHRRSIFKSIFTFVKMVSKISWTYILLNKTLKIQGKMLSCILRIKMLSWQELRSCWDGQPFGHNRHRPKSGGCCAPLFWGEVGPPSNTMLPGPRPTSVPSSILIHPAVWPQQTWAKKWGTAMPLFWGAWSPSNTMWAGPRPTSLPSSSLIHPAICPQQTWVENWGLCPVWGELGPHLTQCGKGRGLPPHQVASWYIHTYIIKVIVPSHT